MAQQSTVVIDKFLGLRQDTAGDLTLEVGELAELKNCRITENYKIKKREGYIQAYSLGSNKSIRGMWYGKLGSTYHFVFAVNGHVYKLDTNDGTTTDLGTLTDAVTFFFAYNDKLYIQNGNEYKYWTGAGNIADVAGYAPKVAVATPPAGGGTPYEDINALTGKKHQTFNGNNSATAFTLAESAITSVDAVYVGGVQKTVTTHYTVNTTTGVVTFTAGNTPPSGTDNVDIYWTKGTGNRSIVTAHKQSVLFGGANDSRVFMYGVDNKIIYSALAAGVPSAEYFPENNYLLVGSDEYDVTGLTRQYDRLIIHKEADTHYCVYDYDVTNGASFPTYPLNDSVGNIAFGQVRTILNNPYAITGKGLYQFVATNVRDEKNAQLISDRVQVGLDGLTLSTAVTFDWEKKLEYMVFVGNKGYVYNYRNDTWYYFELADTPSCFIEVNGVAYFGTSAGKIMKFDDSKLSDNGTAIASKWETGFMAFGANYVRKFLNFAWVGLQPKGRSKCTVTWQADNASGTDDYDIEYNLIDFGNINFGDFSLATSNSPKPFRLKLKAKKFTLLKVIGENDSTTSDMVILSLTLPVVYAGMSK